MAVQTITYDDKVALNENPSIADINKVTDDDMNEIKSVVNNNASETSTNTTNITTNTTNIANLQTIATASFTTDKTSLAGGVLTFDTITRTNSKLSLSSGGIKIGAGISKVLVSGNVFFQFNGANQTYIYMAIRKNSSNVSIAIVAEPFNNSFASIPFTPKLVNVQENDVFFIVSLDSKSGTYRGGENSWLTIEVVE